MTKIGLATLLGAALGALAWLLFQLFPASLVKGEAPELRVAVLVDTSAEVTPLATGLSGSLQGALARELRPAPRAAHAFLQTIALQIRDLRIYACGSSAAPSTSEALLSALPVPPQEGALADALQLAEAHLGKRLGPKLAIIWLDRSRLGAADIDESKHLASLGWEIRVYGTLRCDVEAMRALASDLHYAYREPKPGLTKAQKLATFEFPKRKAALVEGFTGRQPISETGTVVAAVLLALLLMLGLPLLHAFHSGRSLGLLLLRSAVVALLFGVGTGLLARYVPPAMAWAGCAGAGVAIAYGLSSTNARWLALLAGGIAVGVLLGIAGMPLDLIWGLALLGAGFGLAVALTEELFRGRYLEVRDRGRLRLVNLGRREVSFGSSPACSYVLEGVNPRIAAVRVGPTGPYRVDAMTARQRNLHPGELQRIGRLEVVAHGRWGGASSASIATGNSFSLRVGDRSRPLVSGAKFSAAEIPVGKASSEGTVAEVTDSPNQPGVLGLTNRSGGHWYVTLPTGAQTSVPPGRTVKLASGTRISFGAGEGVIESAEV